MAELTYTEMLEKVIERAKEFQKVSEYSDYEYVSTDIDTNCIVIVVGKTFCGFWDESSIEVTFDEFNSKNGIQMYLDRLKQEEFERQQKLEEDKKAQEEKNKELRFKRYLKLKEEFENDVLEEK